MQSRGVHTARALLDALLLLAMLGACTPALVSRTATCGGVSPPFPRACDFEGEYRARAYPSVSHGQSHYFGVALFLTVERSLVSPVLPAGVELAVPKQAGFTRHTVLLLYGEQRDTSWAITGWPQLPGSNYRELILLIPFVTGPGGRYWHTYAARMYLNDEVAIALGALYGYAKQPGDFNDTGSAVTVAAGGTPYFRWSWSPPAFAAVGMTSEQARVSLPGFAALQEIMQMPILGMLGEETEICSYFEWVYDSAEVAQLQTSDIEFLQPFREGMQSWVALGPLQGAQGAALAMRNVVWRLEWPPPRPNLSCTH